MYIPLTIAVLGLLTVAMIVLRFFWWRLPLRLQTLLPVIGAGLALLRLFSVALQWSTTSLQANVLLQWGAVLGYELLLVRFSLMRPQWLTAVCAAILFVPLFGSTLLLPLTKLFHRDPVEITSIGGSYLGERMAWESVAGQNTGYDLTVYYRPPLLPFLRHQVQRFAFNTVECDAAASYAVANPAQKTVRFFCPGNPGQQPLDHTLALP